MKVEYKKTVESKFTPEPEAEAAIKALGVCIGKNSDWELYLFYEGDIDMLREERRILNEAGKTLACHQIHVLIHALVKGDGVVRVWV